MKKGKKNERNKMTEQILLVFSELESPPSFRVFELNSKQGQLALLANGLCINVNDYEYSREIVDFVCDLDLHKLEDIEFVNIVKVVSVCFPA